MPTISDKDVIYAAISMDVYNRGYNGVLDPETLTVPAPPAGVELLYTSSDVWTDQRDSAISFFAAAYRYDGKIIICYRGTDDPLRAHKQLVRNV